jgi:hypothetical protein
MLIYVFIGQKRCELQIIVLEPISKIVDPRKKRRILPFDSLVIHLSAVIQALNSALQGRKAPGVGARF